MRKCPNPKCGFIVENDQALFCKKCGTRLPAFEAEHAEESADESAGERADGSADERADGSADERADESAGPAATAPDEPVSFQEEDGGDGEVDEVQPPPPPLPFEPQKKPDNHLLKAILSTVLCIPLIGLVAIVYAAQVDSCYSQGFYDEAMEKSRRANAWGNAAIIVGLVIYFVVFVFLGVMMYYVGDSSYSDYDYNY